jgi:hypothetical protein
MIIFRLPDIKQRSKLSEQKITSHPISDKWFLFSYAREIRFDTLHSYRKRSSKDGA